jgi:hypothetical protein
MVDSWGGDDVLPEEREVRETAGRRAERIRRHRSPWAKVVGAVVIVSLTIAAGARHNWVALGIGVVVIIVVAIGAIGMHRETIKSGPQ